MSNKEEELDKLIITKDMENLQRDQIKEIAIDATEIYVNNIISEKDKDNRKGFKLGGNVVYSKEKGKYVVNDIILK